MAKARIPLDLAATSLIHKDVKNTGLRLNMVLKALGETYPHLLRWASIRVASTADTLPWQRRDKAELRRVVRYLEGKQSNARTAEDWLLMVDLLIQRYLAAGVIHTEAEYQAVRAAMLGKIQAYMARVPGGAERIEDAVELVPTSFAAVPPRVLTPVERGVLRVSKARAAENISGVTEEARLAMKAIIIEHVQAHVLGQKEGTVQALAQRLFDSFGALNLDFYQIAVTEMGECSNQGFVAAQPPGAKVRRSEAYQGACLFCRSIDGKVFEVVPAHALQKNGLTQVWVGKTNIGRSPSLSKADGVMFDRPESEVWWPAAGLQHNGCRGRWLSVSEKPPEVSQEFEDWLQALMRKK